MFQLTLYCQFWKYDGNTPIRVDTSQARKVFYLAKIRDSSGSNPLNIVSAQACQAYGLLKTKANSGTYDANSSYTCPVQVAYLRQNCHRTVDRGNIVDASDFCFIRRTWAQYVYMSMHWGTFSSLWEKIELFIVLGIMEQKK